MFVIKFMEPVNVRQDMVETTARIVLMNILDFPLVRNVDVMNVVH